MDFEKNISIKLREFFNNKFKLLFISEDRIIIVTEEDKVYEFERNFKGLLEFNKDIDSFIESNIVNELCFKQIIDIKNGFLHVIARTIDGKVYCWGRNNCDGILGNGKNDNIIYKPELNEYLSDKQITDICCGQSHSLVLTNSGEVYAWGWNEFGQIGNGRSGGNEFELIPIKVSGFNDEKVKQISCGFFHSMALTESGRVFSWGYNVHGQLGQNKIHHISVNIPSIVLLSHEISIKKISCGRFHSLLLSSDAHVYWFGFNACETQKTPNKLLINENKFIDIATHYYHFISIALSMNGIYYVWGECGEKEKIKEPKETEFKSFNDIFNHYFGITYKTAESERFIDFKIELIKNGKYLKEWKEIKKLGEGYYGQVFRVKDDNNGEYAIKKVEFTIENEKDLLKELENFFIVNDYWYDSNITKLYDIWIENDEKIENQSEESLTLYIQMELCAMTLEKLIEELQHNFKLFRKKKLTLLGYYIACYIFKGIIKGLNYLHTKKPTVLHMDLHSGNVLMKKSKYDIIEVKLADFGLAKTYQFAQKSQTITSKTRSNYKSFNVLSNGSYSTRDDIKSLGDIMNELFSIHTNSDMNSILTNKYQNAKDLMIEMKSNSSDEGLDCETILRERNEWVLTENEFNAKEEFEKILNSSQKEEKESFVYSIIEFLNKYPLNSDLPNYIDMNSKYTNYRPY